ncbi:MAG: putative CoA-binding protein [bacterium]|jgi:predicted CoA-binding protein
MTDIKTLRRILDASQTVAVVGMSNKVHRPSYFVGKYLLDHGYTVYPVNPMFDEVLGLKSYASLEDIPGSVDIVDCFRRANQMVDITRSAIDLNAKVLWMQLGVINEEAAKLAGSQGLEVVMNRCTKIEHARLFGGLNWAGVNTGIISSRRPKKINL